MIGRCGYPDPGSGGRLAFSHGLHGLRHEGGLHGKGKSGWKLLVPTSLVLVQGDNTVGQLADWQPALHFRERDACVR